MNPQILDSFVFDISLFDYPVTDYKEAYNSAHTINLATIGVKILDVLQNQQCLNMFELKGHLFNYLAIHLSIPQSNNYQENSEVARILHLIDRCIVFYIGLSNESKDITKRERRNRFLKFIIADMYSANAYCLQ